MRVLITGAGGRLGRALMQAAPAAADPVALSRADLDIADRAAIDAIVDRHRPDLVINAAAYTAVDAAEQAPDAACQANRDGPAQLADAVRRHGGRLVHISTDFVFDGHASRPYRPADPPAPLGVYGASKAAGEAAVRQRLPAALIVRTGWLYAGDDRDFVGRMLQLLAAQDAVGVVDDQIGTPTRAASLARAIWRLVDARASGIHHFTDAGVASRYDFAQAIREEALAVGRLARAATVHPIATADFPTPARRPAFGVLDKSATWALLGGAAAHWREELTRALRDGAGG
ncbi:MAG: dTDP-4-dehydrorhamnose reductase [Sphingomonadaceae bacterium]|nr:dTDP-4-dehydrorhamnose reductase [Sphingomonadaceae bacterium]